MWSLTFTHALRACVGVRLQADKISTLVKAANVSVEAYWPTLFAKLLEKHNVDDLVTNIGSGRLAHSTI